ncbi:MAG: septum formation protein Maf [Verrucomicrobiales bacterium]|nr:septum formation protein Maf [Verrucomicrobiales bacterium]
MQPSHLLTDPPDAPRLILASASPRRSVLLRKLLIPFTTVPATVREADGTGLTGRETAMLNAHRKARTVAKSVPDALVLGADTVVCLGTLLLGKPRDSSEAREMLEVLQGRTHEVITAVCLVELRSHRERLFYDATDVTFRPLNPSQIQAYHNKIDPLDKAGAYAIQEHGEDIVAGTHGSFSNIVGLPLEMLEEELKAGWPGLFRD